MYCSIYNDKRFDTKKIFIKNLIKSSHFSSSVRTPPNKYHINYIGELKMRQEPHFDILFTSSIKQSDFSTNVKKMKHRNIIKIKSSLLPKLLLNKNNIINNTNTNNDKCIFTNRILNNENNIGIIDLNFPYCKSKLKNSKSNVILRNNKNNLKNKYLNLKNIENNNNKKSNRLFLKTLSNFHQIINKIEKDKIV